jgi:hypothetical protein
MWNEFNLQNADTWPQFNRSIVFYWQRPDGMCDGVDTKVFSHDFVNGITNDRMASRSKITKWCYAPQDEAL